MKIENGLDTLDMLLTQENNFWQAKPKFMGNWCNIFDRIQRSDTTLTFIGSNTNVEYILLFLKKEGTDRFFF